MPKKESNGESAEISLLLFEISAKKQPSGKSRKAVCIRGGFRDFSTYCLYIAAERARWKAEADGSHEVESAEGSGLHRNNFAECRQNL